MRKIVRLAVGLNGSLQAEHAAKNMENTNIESVVVVQVKLFARLALTVGLNDLLRAEQFLKDNIAVEEL